MGRLNLREGTDPAQAHRVNWVELAIESGSLESLLRAPILREDLKTESGWAGHRGMAPAAGGLGFTPCLPWRCVPGGGGRAGDEASEDPCGLCLAELGTGPCLWGRRGGGGVLDRDLRQETREERLGQLGGGTGPLSAVPPKLSLVPPLQLWHLPAPLVLSLSCGCFVAL